jgi:broad specificity phosphatase PhoE
MLSRILLIRHGQSQEDVDPNVKGREQDHRISITSTGKQQVLALAKQLRSAMGAYQRVRLTSSHSTRARQTMRLFEQQFPSIAFETTIEPCVRNLDWGNVDESSIRAVEAARYRAGVLYFQFPGGDNTPAFVADIETYVERLLRDGVRSYAPECVIIFTHGFALRVIAKALLKMSDEEFRYLANPPNCYVASFSVSHAGVIIEEPLPRVTFDI